MPSHYADWAARIRVPSGFLLAAVYLFFSQPTPARLVWGGGLGLAGLLLRAVSTGFLAKNQRLTTGGPYAHTRNPLYLGSALAGVGFCVAGGRWWFLVLLAVFLTAVYLPVIRREEEHLRKLFPEEFPAYVRGVPMLLPRLSAPAGLAPVPRTFDAKLYWKNREYQALFAYISIILFLIGKMYWTGRG